MKVVDLCVVVMRTDDERECEINFFRLKDADDLCFSTFIVPAILGKELLKVRVKLSKWG